MQQTIDISGGAAKIDAGLVAANLEAWLGGYADQPDYATVGVAWKNASGSVIRTDTLEKVTAVDRGHVTKLIRRALPDLVVPNGTRSAVVIVKAIKPTSVGVNNDGYIDNLALRLREMPKISVTNASVSEGGKMSFEVKLSKPANATIKVDYATKTGTAGTADYYGRSGTLKFNPGDQVKTITVTTKEDAVREANEKFTLKLSKAVRIRAKITSVFVLIGQSGKANARPDHT